MRVWRLPACRVLGFGTAGRAVEGAALPVVDGPAANATLSLPKACAVDLWGNLYW